MTIWRAEKMKNKLRKICSIAKDVLSILGHTMICILSFVIVSWVIMYIYECKIVDASQFAQSAYGVFGMTLLTGVIVASVDIESMKVVRFMCKIYDKVKK
jgi:hypothetical protein